MRLCPTNFGWATNEGSARHAHFHLVERQFRFAFTSSTLAFEDKANTLVLSLASIWEMQIKSQLGKLTFNQPLPEIIQSQQQANSLELLPITTAHIYALQNLPIHHRDPFDRLLIAQANVEQMPLITADPVFHQYEVKLLG